tara:strand:+ start:792 stop:947 length:156 start_codon:yes stop_codon:yes gene_type:complete
MELRSLKLIMEARSKDWAESINPIIEASRYAEYKEAERIYFESHSKIKVIK